VKKYSIPSDHLDLKVLLQAASCRQSRLSLLAP
jgi:hypothetical protein